MFSDTSTVIKRSTRPTIPVQEGTFFLYPENQQFLQGERNEIAAIKLSSRHVLMEFGFLYFNLFLLLFLMIPLATYEGFGMWGYIIGMLIAIPLIFLISYLVEKQINAYLNKRLTERYHREGQLVAGVVESVGGASLMSFNRGRHVLKYSFTAPSTTKVQWEIAEKFSAFRGRPMPTAGTPILVLYFDDKSHYIL